MGVYSQGAPLGGLQGGPIGGPQGNAVDGYAEGDEYLLPRRFISDDISRFWLQYKSNAARGSLWRSENPAAAAAAAAAAATGWGYAGGMSPALRQRYPGSFLRGYSNSAWGPPGGPRGLQRYCSEAEAAGAWCQQQQQQQQHMSSALLFAATTLNLYGDEESPAGVEGRLRDLLQRLEGGARSEGLGLIDAGGLLSCGVQTAGGGGVGVGGSAEEKENEGGVGCILKCWRVFCLLLQLLGAVARLWMLPALTSPAALLAVLARTLAWCGVWLWATTYMERPTDAKGLLNWSFTSLPASYDLVEALFVWMVSWDYCLGLLAAESPLRYILSPHALIDLITLPVSAYVIRLLVGDPRAHAYPWLLGLGWLRFLRLLRTEGVLATCFPTLSLVCLRVVSIGVSWLMIVLTFAGGIFILEAPDPAANYISVFDLCFYAVVTVMTVGYGDFAPRTAAGRGLAMCVIVSAFAYLPGEIQRLMEALREPRTSYGAAPTQDEDYICILGPIQPQQLSAFCFEVGRVFPGSSAALLVISPLPIAAYVDACQQALKYSGLRICIRGGPKGAALPSAIRSACAEARAVFVFSNSRPYSLTGLSGSSSSSSSSSSRNPKTAEGPLLSAGSGESVETREQEEDQATLLRFLGARAACFPMRPISVQLLHDHRKGLVFEMGAFTTLCISEVKMQLLGKSCAGCPGFLPLVGCWFAYSKLQRRQSWRQYAGLNRRIRDNFQHYERGTTYTAYRLEFPRCMQGVSFLELARILYLQHQVFLIGLITFSNRIALNPSKYNVGDELAAACTTNSSSSSSSSSSNAPYRHADDPAAAAAAAAAAADVPVYAGIVLAPNLEVVARLASAKDIASRRRHTKPTQAGMQQTG